MSQESELWALGGALWLVVVPILIVEVLALVDIWRRPGWSNRRKLTWSLLCWLFWVMLVAYLLSRPLAREGGSRRVLRAEPDDPRSQLVALVLDHDEGRLSDEQFRESAGRLRSS